jgi:hypothetical protein
MTGGETAAGGGFRRAAAAAANAAGAANAEGGDGSFDAFASSSRRRGGLSRPSLCSARIPPPAPAPPAPRLGAWITVCENSSSCVFFSKSLFAASLNGAFLRMSFTPGLFAGFFDNIASRTSLSALPYRALTGGYFPRMILRMRSFSDAPSNGCVSVSIS